MRQLGAGQRVALDRLGRVLPNRLVLVEDLAAGIHRLAAEEVRIVAKGQVADALVNLDLQQIQGSRLGIRGAPLDYIGVQVVDFVQHEIQPAPLVDHPEVHDRPDKQRQLFISVDLLGYPVGGADHALMPGPGLDHLLNAASFRRVSYVLACPADDLHDEVQGLENQRAHPGVIGDGQPGDGGEGKHPPLLQIIDGEPALQAACGLLLEVLDDLRSGTEDRLLEPAGLHVVPTEHGQLVVHRILPGQIGQCPAQGGEKAWHASACRHAPAFRPRIDIDQPAIHLAEGAMHPDGLDTGHDRLVVENAAIHQHRLLGILATLAVIAEILLDEMRTSRPGHVPRGQQIVHLAYLGRRKRSRVGSRRPRGEGQRGEVVDIELAEQMPGPAVLETEAQQMPMLALVGHRWVMDEDGPLQTMEIRHRQQQIELCALGQQ
ncbi:hypothetical protein D3C84_467920 [compost metagenome]